MVKEKIELATLELAKTLRVPEVVFVPVPYPRLDVVASVSGTIGLSAYFFYRQKKEDEKYRKSIRKSIQIIKNRG